MPNDAFSAAERRHLEEDPELCDRCPNEPEPGSALCARCGDDEYDREGDHG